MSVAIVVSHDTLYNKSCPKYQTQTVAGWFGQPVPMLVATEQGSTHIYRVGSQDEPSSIEQSLRLKFS